MTAIQQVLIHHSSSSGIQPDGNGPTLGPPNSCFVTHGDDRVSNANNDHPCFGIPDHSWQTNGTHMVSDGADWLIPDHRNYNKVIVIGRGTSTSSGGYPDQVGNIGTLTGEQSAMLTQDQGVNWSESGLNMHNYTSNTNWTTWYDWATNGSMSDPVWIAVGGGFPSSAGYQGDGNNIAIYKSTNFTDWTRILVTPDYTYGDQGNQFISCICYSNGTWIIGNDPTGSICTSTDDGATWSNWYTVSGAYLDAYTIASNNGGSKVMMAIQENHPTHNKSIYYSSDSGATWDSGHEFKPGDFGVVINNIQYFDKQIKVGTNTIGPGVWVVFGSHDNNCNWGGCSSTSELIYYSTDDGTSWTEIDVQNDVSPAAFYKGAGGELNKIIDTGQGKFITWKWVGTQSLSYEKWYMSDESLTDWTEFASSVFSGVDMTTGGSSGTGSNSRDIIFCDNGTTKRLIACSGIGSSAAMAAGRVATLDFVSV